MQALDHRPLAAPDARRRWKWLGVLSGAALLVHLLAFSGLHWAWPQSEPPPPRAAVQVRVVDAPPAPPEPVAAAVVSEPSAASVTPPPPRANPVAVPIAQVRARVQMASAAPAARIEEIAAPAPPVLIAAIDAGAPPAPTADDDETIPRYRTRVPPPMTLRYEWRRSGTGGVGELSWRPQGERYELRLDASVGGVPLLTQVSVGSFDAAGVAPLRFTDRRGRKATTAANFQREAGKITFSGSASSFALREGAQDRLSWMMQLAAIVAAEPQLGVAGAKVAMRVVGSHGDIGVWVFRCLGPETVETPDGPVAAIRFSREPREAYDTTVQVWLDPLRHGLPVRVVLKSGASDEGSEWLLVQATAPP